MTEKLCKKCNHRINRHEIEKDKQGKQLGIYCIDCECSTVKKREFGIPPEIAKQGLFG